MGKKPMDTSNIKVTPAALAFREFRQKLEKEGWFERNWFVEALQISAVLTMIVIGTLMAKSYPIIASIILGVGTQQAGWLGHDYGHGRGKACVFFNRVIACTFLGFSSGWWSHKHNTHHAFPNRADVDVDIHNEPIIHLWFPKADSDIWYRRYQ